MNSNQTLSSGVSFIQLVMIKDLFHHVSNLAAKESGRIFVSTITTFPGHFQACL